MTKVTVVVENTALRDDLLTEHGLALWLETPDGKLLYDTGAGRGLLPNLKTLGLDPLGLDCVVLSHGHLDHTGGLAGLLMIRAQAGLDTEVWCHPDVFASHLVQEVSGLSQGGPPHGGKADYEALGARFHWVEGKASPLAGVTLLAPILRQTDFEVTPPRLVALMPDGSVGLDPFLDDLGLVVETEGGVSLLTGCAHSGIINLLYAVEKETNRRPTLLLGGTHLGPAPATQQEKAMAELAARPELYVAAGHCTGEQVQRELARRLGQRALGLSGGQTFEL